MTLRGCQRQKYPACQEGIGKGKELDAKRVSTTEVPGLWWLTSQGDRQSDPRGKAQEVGQHSTEGHHKLWYYLYFFVSEVEDDAVDSHSTYGQLWESAEERTDKTTGGAAGRSSTR